MAHGGHKRLEIGPAVTTGSPMGVMSERRVGFAEFLSNLFHKSCCCYVWLRAL